MNEREKHEHPSFGMVRFSRASGYPGYFFGSELVQQHYVTLEISPGEMERDLYTDWYYARHSPYISVRMTSNQFAELITSMNMGNGIPCTIEDINGKRVEQLKEKPESKKEMVHREFRGDMKKFAETLKEKQQKADFLIKKKMLSKEDQRELSNILDSAIQQIQSNIPFMMECFQESMDKVVLEAKTEVEAAVLHKITTLGLEKLHDEQRLLK